MKINLLKNYPKTNRDTSQRSIVKTSTHQSIARQFGKEFFDGPRELGYGGFSYDPKWWTLVVKDIIEYYNLKSDFSVLDVGCAKGYMLYDFIQHSPNATIRGIDISEYAIKNAKPEVAPFLEVGNAKCLKQFSSKSFDLVISINTVHNLNEEDCKRAIREIERVGKNKFITVDSWQTSEEERAMKEWNLTALTMKSNKDWEKLLKKVKYTGDYYWFTP